MSAVLESPMRESPVLAATGGDTCGPVGLLAGWGRYPQLVAEKLRQQGRRVSCVAFLDHTDPRLRELCDDYVELGVARLGAALRFFRRCGVRQVTMAGKLHKVLLFRRFIWLRHFPDWQCVRTFFPHFITGRRDRKDDTLLTAVVDLYERHGLALRPATDFVPELLVKYGTLTKRRPSRLESRDIEFGWSLAKELGRVDVGQSVAVKGRAVLAVEAVEGTDQCIQRAGTLCTSGGFTVVKVAKPQQDMRFDVPTIGLGTVQTLHAAGGHVLAVEAGKTIIIDEPEVIDFANRHHLSVVAIRDGVTADVAAEA